MRITFPLLRNDVAIERRAYGNHAVNDWRTHLLKLEYTVEMGSLYSSPNQINKLMMLQSKIGQLKPWDQDKNKYGSRLLNIEQTLSPFFNGDILISFGMASHSLAKDHFLTDGDRHNFLLHVSSMEGRAVLIINAFSESLYRPTNVIRKVPGGL